MPIEADISPDVIREPFWSLSPEETLAALQSAPSGLSAEEAGRRLKFFGPNAVEEKVRLTRLSIFLRQFKSPLIVILIVAGGLTILLADWIETAAIFAAVLVNAALGFWQENKAERALELLKGYIRTRARVRRDDREHEIDAAELVPGDLIRVTQGDRVPADARIIFAKNFEVDESILTGESLPVPKSEQVLAAATILPERTSMVFSGTLAFQGFADCVVTATGPETEFGKIAALIASKTREVTPLQRAISRFASTSGIVLGALTIALFIGGLIIGYNPYEMFLIAIAVAVSAVPEGLPIALTVILAIGVERLAKKNGVVRKLLAAETLGSTTLILTDKTGTLTEARMSLEGIVPYRREGTEEESEVLREALLNSDVVIENPDEPPETWRISGRPLEIALVQAAVSRGILFPYIAREHPVLDRLPFSSDKKFSASLYRRASTIHLVMLGAPEIILTHTNIPENERALIEEEVNARAYAGERVLAVATENVAHAETALQELAGGKRRNLDFRGLISLRDPLRPETKAAVARIRKSGVRTVILTGDHKGTAESVARELGLIDGKGVILTGEDLEHLSEEELAARADQVAVYARVSPRHKLDIAMLYQKKGEIVAVTGDGINDAPALQAADIGVAVGSGTDVAKSAADLVLLDDNFNTLVTAIEEGRKILDNIRKVIVYLLSDSLDELLLIGGALAVGLPIPLTAIQILFVNFFSDSFPAVALAFEDGIDHAGNRARRISKRLIDHQVGFLVFGIGILTSSFLFILYWALSQIGEPIELIRTFIFATFATYTLFIIFPIRSFEKSIVSYNPFSNRYAVAGVGIGFLLTLAVIYVPALNPIFKTTPLPLAWIAAAAGVGILSIVLVELAKFLFRRNMIRV